MKNFSEKNEKMEKELKKHILYLSVGLELFLFSFFVIGFLIDYLVTKKILLNYELEQYGLFGVLFFLSFLAYLIVKFKAFDIKLLGAQALIAVQFILIASMLAFVSSTTSRALIVVILLLTIVVGWQLIKSVKLEMKRKEELQYMSERLATANDQLRKLDNAKTEFISIASHQLRTPLTVIKGFVSLILEGTYGEVSIPVREALNKIYLSGERLINLVENLLNISRIESGRMEYQMNPIHLEDMLNELYDTFTVIAKNKGLTLDINLPEHPLPEIKADQSKIYEVISNFVDNAIKYTKKGGVTIKVETKNKVFNSEGEKIRITVSDTGIGIPESEIQYLFAKFSRGKDTTRLNAVGTGLGLYVAKNIIEGHGGKVWVESDGVDRGSRFIIELPINHEA